MASEGRRVRHDMISVPRAFSLKLAVVLYFARKFCQELCQVLLALRSPCLTWVTAFSLRGFRPKPYPGVDLGNARCHDRFP